MNVIHTTLQRKRWTLGGQVQGVGFRPYVYRLATELDLIGSIHNTSAGVVIEVQGSPAAIESFSIRLISEAPPLAHVGDVRCESVEPDLSAKSFQIISSSKESAHTVGVTPDAAICPDCLHEMRDRSDGRHAGYPLLNCTNCGPRFSIVQSVPYDRANTTMAGFDLCPDCRREYEDQLDRRFHAQPTACHRCGPSVELVSPDGKTLAKSDAIRRPRQDEAMASSPDDEMLAERDPISAAARRLIAGQIIAIKGIGGYHLACLADRSQIVQRLRDLKHRPTKPLALMVSDVKAAESLIELSDDGRSELTSPAAPIVIARRRPAAEKVVCPQVAPGSDRLGVMIASTPLHHLVFDALVSHRGAETQRKQSTPLHHLVFDELGDSCVPLVMTSANDGDEPIVFDDDEAVAKLGSLCDAILRHNRPIQRPVDDSVVLDISPRPLIPLRRARGYAPAPVLLPLSSSSPGVALGAELKSTLCIVREDQAILSQHLGDLGNTQTFHHFVRCLEDFQQLFEITPKWIAHDLHPAYLSTWHAGRLAKLLGLPETIAVQHHHAHAAAVLAEHGLTDPAIAIVCDGTGYGTDGTTWGGELFIANLQTFKRVGHLSPIQLPGGDISARQPWRSALAMLKHAYGESFAEHPILGRLRDCVDPMVVEMVRTGFGCVASSSTGRVFDGVAALLGLATVNHFEAEAPQALEAAAARSDDTLSWNCGTNLDIAVLIRNIVEALTRGVDVPVIARRFHRTLALMFASAAIELSRQTGLTTVALSGGVMCNAIFVNDLAQYLEAEGLHVLTHKHVPANDGGIAFGQAAVAVARRESTSSPSLEGN